MAYSAFGVDHGELSKAFNPFRGAKKTAQAAKAVRPAFKPLTSADFKPITPKKPTGPGSLRAKMDPSAWETQTAAKNRKI